MSDPDDDPFVNLGAEAAVCEDIAVEEPGDARLTIPGDSRQRSKLEHHYVCALARLGKAKKRKVADKEAEYGRYCSIVSVANRGNVNTKALKKAMHVRKGNRFLKSFMLERRGKALPLAEELEVAFHRSIRADDVARAMGLHKSTIAPTRLKVAHCAHRMVVEKLQRWESFCRAKPPLLAFHGRKYDSATFSLRNPIELPGLGKLASNKTLRPIHCYVQRRFLMLCWQDCLVDLSYPVPTLPAASTNAECVRVSMHDAPQVSEMQTIATNIVRTAKTVGIEGNGSDGAFGNLKYHAFREHHDGLGDDVQTLEQLCGNHSTKITEDALETLLGKDHITKLAAFTTLLRSGGFFVRMLSALFPAILERLWLVDNRPPLPGSDDLLLQLESHSVYYFRKYETAYREEGRLPQSPCDRYAEKWATFRKWWNDKLDGTHFVYHNLVESGLNSSDKETIAIHMARSAADILLPSLPKNPEAGKWTKTVAACDFWQILNLPEPLVEILLDEASKHIKIAVVVPDAPLHTLTFSESQGVRLKHSKDLVKDQDAMLKLRVTHLCYNATRVLHAFFFKCSRDLHDPTKTPLFLDYINAKHSPATVAVQYASSLASGVSPHLKLVWRKANCDSLLAFADSCPEQAAIVRIASYALVTSIHRRSIAIRELPLSQLLSLADVRIPLAVRRLVAIRLKTLLSCDLGRLVFHIVSKVVIARDMFETDFQRTLFSIALAVSYLLSVADVERRHNRHKNLITKKGSNAFAGFTAKSLCEEVRCLAVRSANRVASVCKAVGMDTRLIEDSSAAAKAPPRQKRKSGFDVFVEEAKQLAILDGMSAKDLCFTVAGRRQLSHAWYSLSRMDRYGYQIDADGTHKPAAIADAACVPPAIAEEPSAALAICCEPGQNVSLACTCANASGMESLPLVPMDGLVGLMSLPDLAGLPHSNSGTIACGADLSRASTDPIHPARYESFCNVGSVTKAQAVQSFTQMSTTVAAEPLHGRVPKKVKYTKLCSELCANDGSNKLPLRLKSAITDTISDLAEFLAARKGCKPLEIPLCEAMLWLEAVTSTVRRTTDVCQLTFANARSGPHDAFQGFVRFQLPADLAFDADPSDTSCRLAGKVVRPLHDEFVEVQGIQGSLVDPMGIGCLSIADASKVAANALAPIMDLSDTDRLDTAVCLRLVTHVRVAREWNARKVVGFDVDWGPKVLPFRALAAHAPAPIIPAVVHHDSDDDFAVLPCPAPQPSPPVTHSMLCDDPADGEAAGSDLVSEAEGDTASDMSDDIVDMHPPVVELIAPAKPTFSSVQDDLNICEVDNKLFVRLPDGSPGLSLGHIEFILSGRFSLKAVCAAHKECSSSSCGPAAEPCQLLLGADEKVVEKYRALLEWLLDGSACSKDGHLGTRNAIKERFGIQIVAPKKFKKAAGKISLTIMLSFSKICRISEKKLEFVAFPDFPKILSSFLFSQCCPGSDLRRFLFAQFDFNC